MFDPETIGQLKALVSVIGIDIVLAGDNAVVVGMAAAGLSRELRSRAILIGILAAMGMRIAFALVAAELMTIVGLMAAGGVLLLWVAWKLWRELRESAAASAAIKDLEAEEAGGDGVGDIFCPEEKRLGLLQETSAMLPRKGEAPSKAATRTTPMAAAARVVGRLGYMSQVEPAAKPHMAAMFTIAKATRREEGRMVAVRKLHLFGRSPTQLAWQEAVAWWRSTLEQGLSVPLMPEATFPRLGERGVAAVFSDAASEQGTGIGAYAPVWLQGRERPLLLYIEHRWPGWAQRALEAGNLSMPAGELSGSAAIALAVRLRLPGLAYLHVHTDCEPGRVAMNSGASSSPQMNFILDWFLGELGDTQLLAWHQPGKRNWAADGLSRDGNGGATAAEVLSAAQAAGFDVERLALPDQLLKTLDTARALPQRASRRQTTT